MVTSVSDASTPSTQDGQHKLDTNTDIEALMDYKVKDPVLPNSPGRAKVHVCPVCSQELPLGLALIDHLKTFHKDVKSYKCEHCTSAFNNLRAMSSHVSIVHQKKQVKCKVCPYQTLMHAHETTCLEALQGFLLLALSLFIPNKTTIFGTYEVSSGEELV